MAGVFENPPVPEEFNETSWAEMNTHLRDTYKECRAGVFIPQVFSEAFKPEIDIAAGSQLGNDDYQDMCLRPAPNVVPSFINRFHSKPPGGGDATYMSSQATPGCDTTRWPIGTRSVYQPLFCHTAPGFQLSPASGNVGIELFYKGSFAMQYVPITGQISPDKRMGAIPTPPQKTPTASATLTRTPTATPSPTATPTSIPIPVSIQLGLMQNAKGGKKVTTMWAPQPGCGIGVFASTSPEMPFFSKVLLVSYGVNQRTMSRQGTLRRGIAMPPAPNATLYLRAEAFYNNVVVAPSNTVAINANQVNFASKTTPADYVTRLAAAIN